MKTVVLLIMLCVCFSYSHADQRSRLPLRVPVVFLTPSEAKSLKDSLDIYISWREASMSYGHQANQVAVNIHINNLEDESDLSFTVFYVENGVEVMEINASIGHLVFDVTPNYVKNVFIRVHKDEYDKIIGADFPLSDFLSEFPDVEKRISNYLSSQQ